MESSSRYGMLVVGILLWAGVLTGCAMCGACYDECYPGYPGWGDPMGCWGPRAGSIRAMGPVGDQAGRPSSLLGQGTDSISSQERGKLASSPQDASLRRAERPTTASGGNSPVGPGAPVANFPRHGPAHPPNPSLGAFSGALPSRKPMGNPGWPSPGQAGWPAAAGPYQPPGTYPAHAGFWSGPLSFLSYWFFQPPQTQTLQKNLYPSGTVASRMAWGSSSGGPSAGPARFSPPASPGTLVPPGTQAGGSKAFKSGGLGSANPTLHSPGKSFGFQNQVGVPPAGVLATGGGQGSGKGQWPSGYATAKSVPPGAGSRPMGVPPEVWAAIPPEDRPTAQILSITDRKLEAGPDASGLDSSSSNLVNSHPPMEVAYGEAGSGSGNDGGLQWLPAAPLPPGSAP